MILRVAVQGLRLRKGRWLGMADKTRILANRLNNGNAGVRVRSVDKPEDLQAVRDILAQRRPAEVEVLDHNASGGLKVKISGLTYRRADGAPSEDAARRIVGQRLSTVRSEIPEATIELREGELVTELPSVLVGRLAANFRADVQVKEHVSIIDIPTYREFDGDVVGILRDSGYARDLQIDRNGVAILDLIDMCSDLEKLLKMLTPEHSTLLILHFGLHNGEPKTRMQIARMRGCGVGRIDNAMTALQAAVYQMRRWV